MNLEYILLAVLAVISITIIILYLYLFNDWHQFRERDSAWKGLDVGLMMFCGVFAGPIVGVFFLATFEGHFLTGLVGTFSLFVITGGVTNLIAALLDRDWRRRWENTDVFRHQQAEKYTRSAKSHLDANRYDQGLHDCDLAILFDSTYAMAYIVRGLCYFLLRQYQRAIEDFDMGIDLYPEHISRQRRFYKWMRDPKKDESYKNLSLSYTSRGCTHHELGNYQEAIKDVDKAIQLMPDLAANYSEQART